MLDTIKGCEERRGQSDPAPVRAPALKREAVVCVGQAERHDDSAIGCVSHLDGITGRAREALDRCTMRYFGLDGQCDSNAPGIGL
jgi:hypothetical protein